MTNKLFFLVFANKNSLTWKFRKKSNRKSAIIISNVAFLRILM